MKSQQQKIELTPSEMAEAIYDAVRSDVIPIILSSPGMAKSSVMRQVVTGKGQVQKLMKYVLGMKLVEERSSTMDLTDWRGVPDVDRKKKRTIWYAPDFVPSEDDEPTCIFFDELDKTPPQVQAPLLQFFLDKKIGSIYTAPESMRIVGAGNMTDDGSYANKIGGALRDRVIFLYMKPDLDDWCRWAYENDIAPAVIAYNRFKGGTALYAYNKDEMSSPTMRGWEKISNIVKNGTSSGRVRDALIAGKIGYDHMIEYTAFERIFQDLPSTDAITLNPDTAKLPDPSKPELVYAISNALSHRMTIKNFGRIVIYLDRLSEEFSVFAVKTALRRDPKLAHLPEFNKWFTNHAEAMQ